MIEKHCWLMRTAAAIITAALLSSGPALADGLPHAAPHLAMMNGSIVQVIAEPAGHVTIVYVQPRPGLWGKVLPGAVLLTGQWQGNRFEATVYGLNLPCRMQVPYPVAGSVNPDGVLTVVGPAPLIDNSSCQIVGWGWDVSSTLSFVPWPL